MTKWVRSLRLHVWHLDFLCKICVSAKVSPFKKKHFCFCLSAITCSRSIKHNHDNGRAHTNFNYIFLSSNTNLIGICQMLLLQLRLDICSALNKKTFNHGLIWPCLWLAQPAVFDRSYHWSQGWSKFMSSSQPEDTFQSKGCTQSSCVGWPSNTS